MAEIGLTTEADTSCFSGLSTEAPPLSHEKKAVRVRVSEGMYVCVRNYCGFYPFRHVCFIQASIHTHMQIINNNCNYIVHTSCNFLKTINCEFLFRPVDLYEMFLGLDYNKSCFQKCILFTFLNYKTNICL